MSSCMSTRRPGGAIADNVDARDECEDEMDSKSGKDEDDEDRDDNGDDGVCVGYEDDAEEEDNVEGDDEEEDVGEEDDNCDVDRPAKFHRTDHGRIMSQGQGAKGQGNGLGGMAKRIGKNSMDKGESEKL